jgi:hypothetical protein
MFLVADNPAPTAGKILDELRGLIQVEAPVGAEAQPSPAAGRADLEGWAAD